MAQLLWPKYINLHDLTTKLCTFSIIWGQIWEIIRIVGDSKNHKKFSELLRVHIRTLCSHPVEHTHINYVQVVIEFFPKIAFYRQLYNADCSNLEFFKKNVSVSSVTYFNWIHFFLEFLFHIISMK